jgi:hypothetical protein
VLNGRISNALQRLAFPANLTSYQFFHDNERNPSHLIQLIEPPFKSLAFFSIHSIPQKISAHHPFKKCSEKTLQHFRASADRLQTFSGRIVARFPFLPHNSSSPRIHSNSADPWRRRVLSTPSSVCSVHAQFGEDCFSASPLNRSTRSEKVP